MVDDPADARRREGCGSVNAGRSRTTSSGQHHLMRVCWDGSARAADGRSAAMIRTRTMRRDAVDADGYERRGDTTFSRPPHLMRVC
jgi:hypothetical protein